MCFIVAYCWVLAAVSLFAAEPEQQHRITTVIRPDARTGKLVRSVVVTPKIVAQNRPVQAAPAAQAGGIDEAVERIAAEQSLPPQLIHSVIRVESNYDAMAVSPKGAQGLMQLIPATARRFGVANSFNPVDNIQGGAKYLKYLLDLYNGNYPLALAAYNAGEGAVAKWGGVPPYPETQNYLIQVRKRLEEANRAAAAKTKEAAPPMEASPPAGPAHVAEVLQADGSVRYVSR